MRRPNVATPPSNRLLAALAPTVYKRLLPNLSLTSLETYEVVDSPGTPARFIYFPTTAVVSMLCELNDGGRVETGMVGNEGMTGMATCLGVGTSPPLTIVQVAGDAMRIRASALKAEFDRGGALHDLLLRYVYVLVLQITQSVGCNTHHLLEARLSRWLLIVHDRVGDEDLLLRHEFLAQMLGTRRSAVTIAAGALREAGLISYSRGRVTVLDRGGLEASACECYSAVKAAFGAARLG